MIENENESHALGTPTAKLFRMGGIPSLVRFQAQSKWEMSGETLNAPSECLTRPSVWVDCGDYHAGYPPCCFLSERLANESTGQIHSSKRLHRAGLEPLRRILCLSLLLPDCCFALRRFSSPYVENTPVSFRKVVV